MECILLQKLRVYGDETRAKAAKKQLPHLGRTRRVEEDLTQNLTNSTGLFVHFTDDLSVSNRGGRRISSTRLLTTSWRFEEPFSAAMDRSIPLSKHLRYKRWVVSESLRHEIGEHSGSRDGGYDEDENRNQILISSKGP